MKIQKGQQLASKTSGVAYGNLGGELQQKLNNLTLNQAIEQGLSLRWAMQITTSSVRAIQSKA